MYGLTCVLYTTGMWLLVASYLGLPVSTTHSALGGILGMAVVFDRGHVLRDLITGLSNALPFMSEEEQLGTQAKIQALESIDLDCVIWFRATDSFPYIEGVGAVVLSWFVSPVLAAGVAALVFAVIRATVLRSEFAFDRAFWAFPVLVMITITLNGEWASEAREAAAASAAGLHLSPAKFDGRSTMPFFPCLLVYFTVSSFHHHTPTTIPSRVPRRLLIDAWKTRRNSSAQAAMPLVAGIDFFFPCAPSFS